MSESSAAIGLASASSGLPPPNSSAGALAMKRPRHRLDQIARRQRTPGLAGAHLDRRQYRLARRIAALEWRRWYPIDAENAHHLFHNIGFGADVGAP